MNKPAAKEPSMDEILSSIRQIIADDDAAAAPAPARQAPMPATPMAPLAVPEPAPEPLTLSAAQIVARPVPRMPVAPPEPYVANDIDTDPMLDMPQGEPALLDPEDVAFEAEMEAEPEPEPEPVPPPPPVVMRTASVAPPVRRAAPPVSRAAPMPDPMLSADMAEELLAPTTDAAVQGTMAKLTAASAINAGGQTIESLMRDMMRPMLKEWLDENLPSLVERVVEREIARISRGAK
jgi:cell pole-organizing protein PopZ